MKEEKFEQIVLRDKVNRLSIARLPKNIKDEFISFAEDEFCEDYGMAFKHVWDNYKFWRVLYENLDYKMNHIINLLENTNSSEKDTPINEIKLLNGEKIQGGEKDE